MHEATRCRPTVLIAIALLLAASSSNMTLAEGNLDSERMREIAKSLDSADAAAKSAAQKGYFFRTAHLISQIKPDLAKDLAAKGGQQRTLAAAVLAFQSLGDHVVADNTARLGEVTVEEEAPEPAKGKKKPRAKKPKKKGGKGGAADSKLITLLLRDKSPTTVEFALLAAAYAANAELKEAVDTVIPINAEISGAKLLYYARAGQKLPEELVARSFPKNPSSPRNITATTPSMAEFSLVTPGQCEACEALGIARSEKYLMLLHRSLFHPDIRVQFEAARAIGRIGASESVPFLAKRIANCDWPVLVEVCEAMGRIPDKRSIISLIKRLRTEKGRFRLDINRALGCIVGKQPVSKYSDWVNWWKQNGESFEVDTAASEQFRTTTPIQKVNVRGTGYFYGLQIYSDRICYVVDSSNSMKGPRIASLKENLTESIKNLDSHVMFNIADFNTRVTLMYDGALTGEKSMGINRVEEMGLSGATISYDGMEQGARLSDVDTLFFLSDGAPVRGQINKWDEIRRAMLLMGRHRPLTISTISFDPTPSRAADMQLMATQNYGESEDIEIIDIDGGDDKKKKKKK